jgi:hypothetical protein
LLTTDSERGQALDYKIILPAKSKFPFTTNSFPFPLSALGSILEFKLFCDRILLSCPKNNLKMSDVEPGGRTVGAAASPGGGGQRREAFPAAEEQVGDPIAKIKTPG